MTSLKLTLAAISDFSSEILHKATEDERNRLLVFDFDGVLANRIENDVYDLPEIAGERKFLDSVAPKFDIPGPDFDTRYLRHLVFQAAALRGQRDILPTEFLGLVHELQDKREPWFVLSARSGQAAVKRMYQFFDSNWLTPTEVFNVGRVSKISQIEYLLNVYRDRRIYYIDDSEYHISDIASRELNCLTLVHYLDDSVVDFGLLRSECYNLIMEVADNDERRRSEVAERRRNTA